MKRPDPLVNIPLEKLSDEVKNKRIALMMNNTALTDEGISLIDVLHYKWKADIKFLLGMEHGVRGELQPGVRYKNQKDIVTGLPIISLYNYPDLRPPVELFSEVDAVVFCAQDAGIRFWTFTGWLIYLIDAIAKAGKEVIILDQPNPLGGEMIEGCLTRPEHFSIIGPFPFPVRHAMTEGELALMYNDTYGIGCNLNIIKMQGWKRSMWYDDTGLLWIPPSTNLPSLENVLGYGTAGLMQSTNLSFGRGTTTPFLIFGAPFINGDELADMLNKLELPGVFFYSRFFAPSHSIYSGEVCSGVAMDFFNRTDFLPVATAVNVMRILADVYKGKFDYGNGGFDRRTGTTYLSKWLDSGESPNVIIKEWEKESDEFKKLRKRFLLY